MSDPKAQESEGPISKLRGDDGEFLIVAWLVIRVLAEASTRNSRRWIPRYYDREDVPPLVCAKVFDGVQALAATSSNRANQPRRTTRRIGETILSGVNRAIAQKQPPKEFGRELGSDEALKADVERLTDEIMKALQDKDLGWTRDQDGRKVRRKAVRNLTAVDFANLWKYEDQKDESIRASEVISLTEGISSDDRFKAVVLLWMQGFKPREISEKVGEDMTPRKISDILAAVRAVLSQRLKGFE